MHGTGSAPLRAHLHDRTGDRAEGRQRRREQRAERVALGDRTYHLSYTRLPPRTAAVLGAWYEKARLADRRAMYREGRLATTLDKGVLYVTRALIPIKLACALLGTDQDTIRTLNRRKRGRLLYDHGQPYVDLARLDLALEAVSLPVCSPTLTIE